MFWPFTVWINYFSDFKNFANSWPSASNFKSFSRSLEQFFLTAGQNKFCNKIPFIPKQTYLTHIFLSKQLEKNAQNLLILCTFSGILTYRLFKDGPKPILKIVHAVIMISVFILTVIALIAVFDFHNLKSIPNMYSVHSWMGILTVILFSFQVCKLGNFWRDLEEFHSHLLFSDLNS